MPASRQTKPIIIASSKPTHNNSNLSPSTPPSPKQVRFAPRSTEVASRPLTAQEAWSLYHFETHARACQLCNNRLPCDVGYGLSQDVRVHVVYYSGEICSTKADSEGKWVRVEIPHGYDRTKDMLGVRRKREKKHAPIVSYDADPRPSRKRESRNDVYVEPARTHRDDERRSRHKPERYEVVEVTPPTYEAGGPVRLPDRAKRGSLYESDMRRPRREYRIEERAPERKEKIDDREWKQWEKEERRERRRREREWREGGR